MKPNRPAVRWVSPESLARHAAENTTAHRLATTATSWIERFGDDYLISVPDPAESESLAAELFAFAEAHGLAVRRIFERRLIKQPGEADVPRQIHGPRGLDPVVSIEELALRAEADFSAGYSVGWFCDQRENRRFLETAIRPPTLLNCFAYTGAFSLAAARVGARTTSIDLSKKSLERARRNFQSNGWDPAQHRFLADDVFAVLPRMARRGERFDAVIMDPPTFSRGAKRRVFRAEDQLGELLDLTAPIMVRGGWILLSTNARNLRHDALRRLALEKFASANVRVIPAPDEYPPGMASETLWIQVP